MNNCVRSVWVSDLLPLELLKKRRVTPLTRAPSPRCKAPGPTAGEGEAAGAPITRLVTVSFLQHLLRTPQDGYSWIQNCLWISLCSAELSEGRVKNLELPFYFLHSSKDLIRFTFLLKLSFKLERWANRTLVRSCPSTVAAVSYKAGKGKELQVLLRRYNWKKIKYLELASSVLIEEENK